MVFIFGLIISQYIYWDATRNKIGRIPEQGGFLNIPAGGWAGLWIVPIPVVGLISWILYFINRSSMIEKAKNNPVELSQNHRFTVHIALLIIPIIILYFLNQMRSYAGYSY
jgi:hypothetical protein